MSSSFNVPNCYPPVNYSGVTIQVANPVMHATPFGQPCMHQQVPQYFSPNYMTQPMMQPQGQFGYAPIMQPQGQVAYAPMMHAPYQALPQYQAGSIQAPEYPVSQMQSNAPLGQIPQASIPTAQIYKPAPPMTEVQQVEQNPAYPSQYYLNNYNYNLNEPQRAEAQVSEKPVSEVKPQEYAPDTLNANENRVPKEEKTNTEFKESIAPSANNQDIVEEDLTKSQNIIEELEARDAEQKELEKNGKKTKVVALTNEYIMSLENYLNNPNSDIRLMASKEVLTRFDEDKSRFDDAALNALINKMLQDPNKLIRIAALSALSSQLASGNEFTVQLLHQIQQNPNSDKEDVLQAADILLKMSAQTEERYQAVPQQVAPQEAN